MQSLFATASGTERAGGMQSSDNPLFGTLGALPTPGGSSFRLGRSSNPIWSPDEFTRNESPQSAAGFKRLGPGPVLRAGQQDDEDSDAMATSPYQQQRAWSPGFVTATTKHDHASQAVTAPEIGEFALVLEEVVKGEVAPGEALQRYAEACAARAEQLRSLAGSQAAWASKRSALLAESEALQLESATWRLLWHLHGVTDPDFPAGTGGGFVAGAGGAKTLAQSVADLLAIDLELNRAARAVAWLEALAGETLDHDDGWAPAAAFGTGDGIWRETMRRLENARLGIADKDLQASLVTELDPDALSRQRGKRLDPDNANDDERLCRAVWRLVRAGRIAEAGVLCRRAGAPWRAAALLGGGRRGPVPVGPAAFADLELEGIELTEVERAAARCLAAEEEDDVLGARRATWRRACAQVACAPGTNAYESATFGILASNIDRVLPACRNWEDGLWAGLRAWLDAAVDFQLGVGCPVVDQGGMGTVYEPVPAAIRKALLELGLPSSTRTYSATTETGVVSGNNDTVPLLTTSEWPPAELRESMGGSFAEAVERAASHAEATVVNNTASTSAARFRAVQLLLILDQISPLVTEQLRDWVLRSTTATTPAVSEESVLNSSSMPDPALLRFAAHLALALWKLGVVDSIGSSSKTGTTIAETTTAVNFTHVQDVLQRLLQFYVAYLIDSGHGSLAPLYCCFLRAGLRHLTLGVYWEGLTSPSDAPIEPCRAAFEVAHSTFQRWLERCSPEEAERSGVMIDETQNAARRLVAQARLQVAGGPAARGAALRWLAFHPDTHRELLREAVAISRELALGGPGAERAASIALGKMLPEALGVVSLDDWLERMRRVYEMGADDYGLSGSANDESLQLCDELGMWSTYFDLLSVLDDWMAAYEAWKESSKDNKLFVLAGSSSLPADAGTLIDQGLPLLSALSLFVSDNCLDLLLRDKMEEENDSDMPMVVEAALVVGPRTPDEHGHADQGVSYAVFEDDNAIHTVSQRLTPELQRGAADWAGALSWAAGPAPDGMAGLMSVAVEVEGAEAGHAAAAVMGLMLKGALPGARSAENPLQVVNMEAPEWFVATLCHTVCLPRLVLALATMREALADLGHDQGPDESGIVLRVAAFLHPEVFAAREAAELLERERTIAVLRLRLAGEP